MASAVHPRSRGERLHTSGSPSPKRGSSPLARGTGHQRQAVAFSVGSSPLARGTARGLSDPDCAARFIPARAGNGPRPRPTASRSAVHPRSRGERNSPDRRQQVEDFAQATRQLLEGQLTRQKTRADRDAKFALARSGLSFGSADADTSAGLQRQFEDGLLDAERRSQGAAADLRNQDEQARLNLIALAQSGLDSTTASEQALSQLQANINAARAQGNQQSLGNLFEDFADIARFSQEQGRLRREQRFGIGGLFGPAVDSTVNFGSIANTA